jgi:hypothetical protein
MVARARARALWWIDGRFFFLLGARAGEGAPAARADGGRRCSFLCALARSH